MELPQKKKKYTYAEYDNFPEGELWEIIDGIPYMQSAPSWQHQSICGELFRQVSNYLLHKSCLVFSAPFDLRLPEENKQEQDVTNVFQPDLLVVCDKSKLKGTGYYGIPDLVMEVVSPATARKDKLLKFNMYEKAGVKEYWIVEPELKLISVFTLQQNNRYGRPELYTEKDRVKISIFQDLIIDLKWVFGGID